MWSSVELDKFEPYCAAPLSASTKIIKKKKRENESKRGRKREKKRVRDRQRKMKKGKKMKKVVAIRPSAKIHGDLNGRNAF